MKIGILTPPLGTNYGGLLQVFALQKVLRDMGHEVLTIDYSRKAKWWTFPERFGRRVIGKFLLGRGGPLFPQSDLGQKIRIHTDRFIWRNIKTTHKIYAPASAKDFDRYHFDAFVVGSDQTWRPDYSPCMPMFFLDFLGEDKTTRRIAYASSFGKSEWTFSSSLTKKCAALVKKIDAISVREDSDVALCEKYRGVSAKHVLVPTMFLGKEDYCKLIREGENGFVGRIGCYFLDVNESKRGVVDAVSKHLKKDIATIMPHSDKIPSIYEFLALFRDSEFIVTDSFHGTVFAIIFNKPFIVIGNNARGLTRLLSLLLMFSLENYLIDESEKDFLLKINPVIDWNRVNNIKKRKSKKGIDFLKMRLA